MCARGCVSVRHLICAGFDLHAAAAWRSTWKATVVLCGWLYGPNWRVTATITFGGKCSCLPMPNLKIEFKRCRNGSLCPPRSAIGATPSGDSPMFAYVFDRNFATKYPLGPMVAQVLPPAMPRQAAAAAAVEEVPMGEKSTKKRQRMRKE